VAYASASRTTLNKLTAIQTEALRLWNDEGNSYLSALEQMWRDASGTSPAKFHQNAS